MQTGWVFHRKFDKYDLDAIAQADSGRNSRKTTEDGSTLFSGSDISLIFPSWEPENERVLFVAPHEDDNHLGAGLLTQAVAEYSGTTFYLVVTDGRNGYATLDQKAGIVETRRKENVAASSVLGVSKDRIMRLGLPDGNLVYHFANDYANGDPAMIKMITKIMRDTGATRVVVPTAEDAHPDHYYVGKAVGIAVFHAGGEIWTDELGKASPVKTTLQSQVYSGIDSPNIWVEAPFSIFQRKLEAIAEFRSQKQIKGLVERVRANGPHEFYATYSPISHLSGITALKHFT